MVPELIGFPDYILFQSNFIQCMSALPLHIPQMDQAKLERSKSLCKHQYRQLIRKHSKINNEAPRKVNTTKRKKKKEKEESTAVSGVKKLLKHCCLKQKQGTLP